MIKAAPGVRNRMMPLTYDPFLSRLARKEVLMSKDVRISDSRRSYYTSAPILSQVLYQIGERITLPRNHVLLRVDEIPEYCYIILSGRIISYETHINGEEQIYLINGPDCMILEGHLLYRIPVETNFVTTRKTELLRIDRQALINAIDQDSDVAFSIIGSITQKFLNAMTTLRYSRNFNTSWKVCNVLLTLAKQYGVEYKGSIMIREKISQQMIANILGVNRITVVNIFRDLKDMGIIEIINGYYCICDMDQMTEYMKEIEK